MDENCDYTKMVDFGKGPVEVRCTRTGAHENHVCQVLLNGAIGIIHRNVFEENDERTDRTN